MNKRKPTAIAKFLRKEIRESGLSGSELARRTGIKQTTLSRFIRGDGDLFEKLFEFFKMQIVMRRRK